MGGVKRPAGMDYAEYEVYDFAADDFFVAWVLGNSSEARCFWEDYLRNNPRQRHTIESARELLLNLQKSEQTLHTPAKVGRMWRRIEQEMTAPPTPVHQARSFSVFRIAASVSLFVGLAFVAWYAFRSAVIPGSSGAATAMLADTEMFLEEVNNTGRMIQIHLSDGSTVNLEDNSRLRYRKDHRGHPFRQVYLTGEAFFDVARNPSQPFLVYTHDVVTKVLGTSFRVKAFEGDDDVLVAVKAGKVSVYSARGTFGNIDSLVSQMNGVVLVPNQQVRYMRTENAFVKTLIDDPKILDDDNAVAPSFIFENMPVTEVFEIFSEAYGVEIIADPEIMRDCFLTVRLANESLFDKLRIVCRTIGARYELIDGKIVIEGTGCRER